MTIYTVTAVKISTITVFFLFSLYRDVNKWAWLTHVHETETMRFVKETWRKQIKRIHKGIALSKGLLYNVIFSGEKVHPSTRAVQHL